MGNVDRNLVAKTDLMNRGFEVLSIGQERGIVPRVSTVAGNRLVLGEDGLSVTAPPMRSFLMTPTANVRVTDRQDFRRILYLTDKFGVLHLDFTLLRSSGNTPLFNVPQDCPLPQHIIEQFVNGGQPLWWVPGERTIYCDSRVTKNQRIIVHASGIFV